MVSHLADVRENFVAVRLDVDRDSNRFSCEMEISEPDEAPLVGYRRGRAFFYRCIG